MFESVLPAPLLSQFFFKGDDMNREQWLIQKHSMESELQELRSQLSKSVAALGEHGELRRNLERNEKQRIQLSDHIQARSVVLILIYLYTCCPRIFYCSYRFRSLDIHLI